MELLNNQSISEYLKDYGFTSPFNLHVLNSIDSTNRYLKELPPGPALEMCCAESQTQGRGRFGRHWHSPFGENIYCSSRWSLSCDLEQLSGLSLVTSLAVIATINQLNSSSGIQLKWPNDILWNNKKLCGSLIEIITQSGSTPQVIIGIGLNVNTDTQNQPLLDKPWCSLFELFQQQFNRNKLIAMLMVQLEGYLSQFVLQGLAAFLDEWELYDSLKGQFCTVTHLSESITGLACGINPKGQLALLDKQGLMHYCSSGDTTLSGF